MATVSQLINAFLVESMSAQQKSDLLIYLGADINLNTHVADLNNPHAVTKTQVGLGSANDTSDADKPVSTATQSKLDEKDKKITTVATNDDKLAQVGVEIGERTQITGEDNRVEQYLGDTAGEALTPVFVDSTQVGQTGKIFNEYPLVRSGDHLGKPFYTRSIGSNGSQTDLIENICIYDGSKWVVGHNAFTTNAALGTAYYEADAGNEDYPWEVVNWTPVNGAPALGSRGVEYMPIGHEPNWRLISGFLSIIDTDVDTIEQRTASLSKVGGSFSKSLKTSVVFAASDEHVFSEFSFTAVKDATYEVDYRVVGLSENISGTIPSHMNVSLIPFKSATSSGKYLGTFGGIMSSALNRTSDSSNPVVGSYSVSALLTPAATGYGYLGTMIYGQYLQGFTRLLGTFLAPSEDDVELIAQTDSPETYEGEVLIHATIKRVG